MIGYTPHELDLRAAAGNAPPPDLASAFAVLAAYLCEHPAIAGRMQGRRTVNVPLAGGTPEARLDDLHALARETGGVVEWDDRFCFFYVEVLFGNVRLEAHVNPASVITVLNRRAVA